MKIGIIGLGLMGGSIAKTAKKRELAQVYGIDVPEVMQKAVLLNAIDGELNEKTISKVDLLFICAYPRQIPDILREYVPKVKDGCIVCDIGGNKRLIVQAMENLSKEYPNVNFVASHPMAGREFVGISHSITTLYDKSSFIIIPVKSSLEATQTLSDFIRALGATNVEYTSADNHDDMIAYTSQLCHVISSAYVKNKKSQNHFGYSAGSFKDLTRVAKLNPVMWSENMIDNRDYLVKDIDILIEELKKYREALATNNQVGLEELLREGTIIKENLKDKK